MRNERSTRTGQLNRESLEALQSGDKAKMEQLVLEHIEACGAHGASADEVTAALGLTHNSVAPRFTSLARQGAIVRLGKERRHRTRSGCLASVYVTRQFAAAPPTESLELFPPTVMQAQEHRDDG